MRVAIRVDASRLIGGGHAMRCLALADTLADHGAHVMFVAAEMPEGLRERIETSGHKLAQVASSGELVREGTNWHEPPLDAAAQSADVQATAAATGALDWLIVDHYLLDARWHSAARKFAHRLLVIDDLANRSYDCNLLVDETGGRSSTDYDGLLPEGATALTGAAYALLRPEFARERPAALERRQRRGPVERLLISLGLTDPGGITASAIQQALAAGPDCAIDVVVSEDAQSLPRLRELASKQPRLTIHVNSNRMAELMRDAGLAIGAAGTTSWERCCLGLPAVALVLAENQRPNADALALAGAAIKIERADQIEAAVASLLSDTQRLNDMSAAAFALTDGLGTTRVADAMIIQFAEASPVRA